MSNFRPIAAAALLVSATGCGRGEATTSLAVRDTLASGTVMVSYPSLPVTIDTLVPDLRLGDMAATEAETFADVRGIEAGADGTIFVLDFQAAELRAFGPDGSYQATLATQGEGPGEIKNGNGMVRGPDGTLWVQDHGNWAIIGFSPEGSEVGREPMMIQGYGYVWDGAIDDRGVFYQSAARSDGRTTRTESGPQEGSVTLFMKSFDPHTETFDSVYIGESKYHSYVVHDDRGGRTVFSMPFSSTLLNAMDSDGALWTGTSDAFRLVRQDPSGDTTLVLEVPVEGPVVTQDDRDQWLAFLDRFGENAPQIKAQLNEFFPERRPVLEEIIVDELGRVWVRRATPAGEMPLYDVFRRDGEHLRSVRMPAGMSQNVPPRVRAGSLYALVLDSLDVQSIIRAPLPASLEIDPPR